MRKLIFSLMIIPIICSCAVQEKDVGGDIRELYAGTDKCTMKAGLTADYGNRVHEFKLRYDFDRSGQSAVTILEPKSLDGIRAVIDAGQTFLDTGEIMLDTGPLGNTGLTPMEALPVLLSTFSEGYLIETGSEKLDDVKYHTLTYKSYIGEAEIEYRVWFDCDTFKPYMAQIFEDGLAVIKCEFDSFEFG